MSGTIVDPKVQEDMSHADVDLLVSYLGEEAEIQGQLLTKLEEKERHLVKQDLTGLETCLQSIEPIVDRLEVCTHRRVRILRSLGGRLGLAPESIQVTALLDRCSDEDRGRLESARGALRGVLVGIGNQNRRNHVLIRNGIELNQAMVYALFGNAESRNTYDRSAQSHKLPPTRSYVNQEL